MSTYQLLFAQLHKSPSPVALCSQLMQASRPKDNQAIAAALAALNDSIQRNRPGRAFSAARALLVLTGPVKSIELLKRHGVLRASSFGFSASGIQALVADWIDHAVEYRLQPAAVTYLTSVSNLCRLAPAVLVLHRRVMSHLRSERLVIIKCLLAEVDASFVYPDEVDVGYGGERPITREELAEAFSYLLGLFHLHFGLTESQFVLTDPDAGYAPRYRLLLGHALKICRYRESEVLLEAFPYHVNVVEDGVHISSIDPTLERSIRLGYVQHEMQAGKGQRQLKSERTDGFLPSLVTLAEQYFEGMGERACRLQLHPLPRYIVELPIGMGAALFSQDAPLVEDAVACAMLAREEYLSLGDVRYQVVHGTVTVMDLYKVQRIFWFLSHGLQRTIDRHDPFNQRAGLYRASCLAVLSREKALSLLSMAVGAVKAPEVLALLTADPSSPGMDIQNAPILAAGKYFMISAAVLASSNLPRNILSRLHQRLIPAAPERPDPMQSQLAQALRESGFLVAIECNLKGGKDNKLETDVLAYMDDHLFVFECKNVFHPCNVYELRNTFNAMNEAAVQLSLRQVWLTDPAHQRELFSKLGWSIPATVVIHTCVALGNRVFNGYVCDGHPVRQVHELLGLLSNGYIEFEDERCVRLWRGETMVADDLVDYLEGRTTHADLAASTVPVEIATPIGDQWLTLLSCGFDLSQCKEIVLARYPAIETPIE